MCTYVHIWMHVYAYASTCVHINICACMHACMHACMSNTLTYKCIDVYTCAYIRMLLRIRMHMYAYVCIHAHPWSPGWEEGEGHPTRCGGGGREN